MRTLTISAKCDDRFSGTLSVDDVSCSIDGYVPHDLGIGGGDYISLTVDLETGQILNWVAPSDEALKALSGGEGDDG